MHCAMQKTLLFVGNKCLGFPHNHEFCVSNVLRTNFVSMDMASLWRFYIEVEGGS